jgi:hypothetical protein
MGAKVDPAVEDRSTVRGTGLTQSMNLKPSLVVERGFNAFQGGSLEFVEVWVRLTGKVERYLLVKREEFVCVLEQVTKSALRSPEPPAARAPRLSCPSIVRIDGLPMLLKNC